MWNYAYTVPENKKVRVIVHTDCKNEADDQYAVAHHLMTPRFDVKGLVAGHFWKNPQQYGELGTAQASYDMVPAPRIAEDMTYIHGQDNREIRVYKYLDARLTLEDFFAKLALNFGDEK